MRLDFNVLWVDDQPDRVEAQIKAIKNHMEGQGFDFNPTLCRSMDDVRKRIAQDVFTDEIDLILVDWDLGEKVHGQEAIGEIRERAQYKDVVFYSAQTTPNELRNIAHAAKLEGVFCAARDGLVDEVIGVFEALVKKVLDLDHTRGIVMGATSDIDHMVDECLITMHQKLGADGQQAMLKNALWLVDKHVRHLEGQAAELRGGSRIEALIESHMAFTAYDRLRTLSHELKGEITDYHKNARSAVGRYMQEVVPERNILGHQILEREGQPPAVTNNKGQPVTVDTTRELRRKILNLRSEFRQLLAALRANL